MKKENIKIEIGNRFYNWKRFFQLSKFLIMLLFVELIIGCHVNAQDTMTSGCNRSVDYPSLLKDLPKDICLRYPKDQIKYIHKKTDINGDGLDDCVIKYGRTELKDGDTLFTAIYFQNEDSTYTLFKTLDNLYPINLKSYNRLYSPKEESLKILQKKYRYEYLLYKLTIEKDKIIFLLKNDAESDLIITYKYKNEIKNWIYFDCIESFHNNNGINKIDLSDELGPTIDNFNYTF
jgi:hypothetical protein